MFGKSPGIFDLESFQEPIRAPLVLMGMRQNDDFETEVMP